MQYTSPIVSLSHHSWDIAASFMTGLIIFAFGSFDRPVVSMFIASFLDCCWKPLKTAGGNFLRLLSVSAGEKTYSAKVYRLFT